MENSIVRIVILIIGLFFVMSIQAQEIPEGGLNIINYERLKHHRYEKEGYGLMTSNKAKIAEEITLTFETTIQPNFRYKLSTRIPVLPTKIKKGEIVLLSFMGKTEYASLETGEARALFVLNISENAKDRIATALSISSDWQQYYLPIEIDRWVSDKNFWLAIQFGFPPQKFSLKNITFHVFDQSTTLENLPRTKITYAGMEQDAAWRTAANERIEALRKGDFEVHFSDKGKAVENLNVQLKLQEHYFHFGTAVSAKLIVNEPVHLQHLSNYFNLVVFENDLKIKVWDRRVPKETILNAIDLIRSENINIKGHVLIWPGFRYLTPEFKNHRNQPGKIVSMTENHIKNILRSTKGNIRSWDVTNETYTNKDLQEITGSEEILYNGFRELHRIDPDVLRFTNEYGIISKGGLDIKKQEWYYDYIQRIDENTNGLVDGIGIQCHIGTDLTPPEKVLSIIDYYAQLDKKISISEFTMDIKDLEVREQYTRDFMIAAFSHSSVSEFLFWGYQSEKVDFFNDDWQLGSMGKAFTSLVWDEWQTLVVAKTNEDGTIKGRGFYGTYEYTYLDGNKVVKGTFDFLPGEGEVITIKL